MDIQEIIIERKSKIDMNELIDAVNNGFEKIGEAISNQNDRLDAHYERMSIISDNLNKTHEIVCANSDKLDKIIKHLGVTESKK